jgi:hypothetical protein
VVQLGIFSPVADLVAHELEAEQVAAVCARAAAAIRPAPAMRNKSLRLSSCSLGLFIVLEGNGMKIKLR